MSVDMARLLRRGVYLWAIALVFALAVPALHSAERSWWPWVCVVGIILGGAAELYVRRGRGNAQAAYADGEEPPGVSVRRRSGRDVEGEIVDQG